MCFAYNPSEVRPVFGEIGGVDGHPRFGHVAIECDLAGVDPSKVPRRLRELESAANALASLSLWKVPGLRGGEERCLAATSNLHVGLPDSVFRFSMSTARSSSRHARIYDASVG